MWDNPAFVAAMVAALGLVTGSFLNVCIWRLPAGKSIVSPGSHCPACGSPIRWYDNVPVLGYLLLNGRCRSCGARISLRYPLVEAANAALWLIVLLRYGLGPSLPAYLALVSALVVITFIDINHRIIPNAITLPGVVLGLIAGAFLVQDPFFRGHALGWQASVVGGLAGFGALFTVRLVGSAAFRREAMGMGDVKLMAMLGTVLGWKGVLTTIFLGSLIGTGFAFAMIILRRKAEEYMVVPFGPYLVAGALVTLIWGQELLLWYISTIYAGV